MPARLPLASRSRAGAAVLAVAAAVAGCAFPTPRYLALGYTNVTLDCRDGYMVYDRTDTKSALVVPYAASEVSYVVCAGSERQPLSTRARLAAEKKLGPKCRITSESSPAPGQYEFTYACS